jgi:hypothetical protein
MDCGGLPDQAGRDRYPCDGEGGAKCVMAAESGAPQSLRASCPICQPAGLSLSEATLASVIATTLRRLR